MYEFQILGLTYEKEAHSGRGEMGTRKRFISIHRKCISFTKHLSGEAVGGVRHWVCLECLEMICDTVVLVDQSRPNIA